MNNHLDYREGDYDYREVKLALALLFAVMIMFYAVGCARTYSETIAIYEQTLPASYLEAHGHEIRTAARAHAAHWIIARNEEVDPWAEFPDAGSV